MNTEVIRTKPSSKSSLTPWIDDKSYQSEEWQKRIDETMAQLRGGITTNGEEWDHGRRTAL